VYAQGSKLGVVSAKDLVAILASNPRMKPLLCETANAFVQRETGSITGLERAIQAATAPSLGQQMLQRGSRDAIANGVSREESSVSVNAEGKQVAERLVQRGVLLPNGQGVQIQQIAQQVVLPESELGKRKIQDDLDRVEIRLKNLQCEKMEIEHEQMKKQFSIDNEQLVIKYQIENKQLVIKNQTDNEQLMIKNQTDNEQKQRDNKTTTVHNFVATMSLLDPQWRDDKRLLLQATDYLKNNTFNGSSAPQIENGAQSNESISIGSVALEMGLGSLSNAKAAAVGKHVAKMYRDRHGKSPSKHNQTIGGNVILVNSYTLRDRDLVEDAIKAAA